MPRSFENMVLKRIICNVLLFVCLVQTIEAQGRGRPPVVPPRKWMTLTGGQPDVVARGGYSGFFPDSSMPSYDMATDLGIAGTILYCNLHFSKDNDGFCISRIDIQNSTSIKAFDPKGEKTYIINGQEVRGWFGLDYDAKILFDNITLNQDIFTRGDTFDGEPLFSPLYINTDKKKPKSRVWLNIEYDLFYQQHKISPEVFLLEMLVDLPDFLSSPEIGFLRAIGPKVGRARTKIIFKFLGQDMVEPTTNKTYGSLLKELPMIKSFAFGILVPKEYIWPINDARYLEPATTLVPDAHRAGLAVYASGFANDNFLSYNYSYDPAREYKQFVENSQFSVDGVLTDFPSTASEAIGCLPQDRNATREVQTLIVSHNGASGDLPGATDLAFQKAIDDGADIIDCSVQMSKDGVAFCSDRADIIRTTTAATLYMDKTRNVPDVQPEDGVFSFDLTWAEIQALQPQMESPYDGDLVRNPANKNSGKFVTLLEFLELAKTRAVPGVLLFIQNAAYLASREGLDVVSTVTTALSNATLDQPSPMKVLIQSDDSSVLARFRDNPRYERVLYLNELISGAPDQVAQEVKKYADSVYVHRSAIVVESQDFAFNFTKTIPSLNAANISVYVGILRNEFMNLMFDYLSDPYLEIATLNSLGVKGLVTDYPATANAFMRSSCVAPKSPYNIKPMVPGFLYQPQPVADPPQLSVAEVVDPPLPPVANQTSNESASNNTGGPSASPGPPSSSATSVSVGVKGLLSAAMAGLMTFLLVQ